jgi:hypothetical protein
VSEPIVYRISIEFATDRALKTEELVEIAQASYAEVVDPDVDPMDPEYPFLVVDPVLRIWAGDSEVAGLNPQPVYHAYIAFYRAYEAGNDGNSQEDADEYLEEYFLTHLDADARSDHYLERFEGEAGARIESGVRMISVSAEVYEIVASSPWADLPDEDEYLARWRDLDLWNPKHRIAEHLRYRTLTRP